jgi:hypothetical protein
MASEFFTDPIATKAYPRLKNTVVRYEPKRMEDSGNYQHDQRRINMGPTSSPEAAEKLFYHEGNHLVQQMEGWPLGTNSDWAGTQLAQLSNLRDQLRREGVALPLELRRHNRMLDAWDKADDKAKDALAYRMYRNEAGEQVAESGAQSVRSAKKAPALLTADPHEMYSELRLAELLRNFMGEP